MGREIRRVAPNWQHPKRDDDRSKFQPLYDRSYREAITKWIKEHKQWEAGKHPDQREANAKKYRYFAEWSVDAPEVLSYRPDWKHEEMTWYQLYETVSEGTPITPAFATREELVEYLINKGDDWDGRWPRSRAEAFVFGDGWAPTFVSVSGGPPISGVEAAEQLAERKEKGKA